MFTSLAVKTLLTFVYNLSISNMEINKEIMDYLQNPNKENLFNSLKLSYKIEISEAGPVPIVVLEEDLQLLGLLLDSLGGQNSLDKELLREVFRCLRNCTIGNIDAQNGIVKNGKILDKTKEVFLRLNLEQDVDCCKMLLAFLLNLSVNNPKSGKAVWNNFAKTLPDLLLIPQLTYNSSALTYNILHKNPEIQPSFNLILNVLTQIESKHDSEFLLFLLEHILKHDFVTVHHTNLPTEFRLIILQEIKHETFNKSLTLSKKFILILIEDFKKKSDCILKTVTEYLKQIEPFEVSLLLDIIALLSSEESSLRFFQYDRSLLVNCVFLLKSIHSAGKEGENNFTAIQKLSELGSKEDLEQHPGFGFKAALIRTIGNLAWKSRCNQDELRELDSIPLLLDCCNIDARNPFIIQCVIFALRNLCEKNDLNQGVIAAMNKQGVIDSATLNELGVKLDGDGDKEIRIVPLPTNK